MIFDRIDWDEHNLDHATRRTSAAEIEQALFDADRWFRHPKPSDRRLVRAETDGGKRVLVVVPIVHDGVRPITGWEE